MKHLEKRKDCHKNPRIALSSTCLGNTDIKSLCEYAEVNNIRSIELSANIPFISDKELVKTLETYTDRINFYIHNYFPAPKDSFVLNLAHPATHERSLKHCLKAVDLCSSLGIAVYSIHAGMAINPSADDLGKSLSRYAPIDLKESRDLLTTACHEIAGYALGKGVRILIENNVINEGNCPENVNRHYHFADPAESEKLFTLFSNPNIGVLLDAGHLKVNATNLNFKPHNFINLFREKINAIHLSDNDGRYDQNLPIDEQSWFWQYLPWEQLEYVSLEIKECSSHLIKKQIGLIEKQLCGYKAVTV
ncbi:MAG: sugar phosphate isomerase/epimerase [Nitrospirae bacterium]|nr:sugar phosphate isomerase/epimerase [Nitrospirota bacterium]MBI3378806.1 sugar phosphate isomerase/epimerase [Nitrospirota bacterium]